MTQHNGDTINELIASVERAEKNAGCYGSGEPTADDPLVEEDSCGAEAAAGKVGPEAGVLPVARSESQQNCAGLGAEWGIPPAGTKS